MISGYSLMMSLVWVAMVGGSLIGGYSNSIGIWVGIALSQLWLMAGHIASSRSNAR